MSSLSRSATRRWRVPWRNGFIVLEEVLDRAEITAYGEAIRDVAMAHFPRPQPSAVVRRRLPATQPALLLRRGAQLRAEPALRVHPQPPAARPGGAPVPRAGVDCSLDMGSLRSVAGSHKYGNLEGMSISEESRRASSTAKWPATSKTSYRSRTRTTGLEPVVSGLTSRRDNHVRHARLAGAKYGTRANRSNLAASDSSAVGTISRMRRIVGNARLHRGGYLAAVRLRTTFRFSTCIASSPIATA